MPSWINIDVPVWPNWIVSQIIGFIAVVIGMYAMLAKRKTDTMFFAAISGLFLSLSLMLLLNWVVVAIFLMSSTRNFFFAWCESRREKGKEVKPQITLAATVVFMIATVVAVAFTWTWWFDWILLASSLFIIYGAWAKGRHKIRIAFFTYDALIIVNYVVFFNPIGLVMSLMLMSATTIFYIRYFRNKKKKAQIANVSNVVLDEPVTVENSDAPTVL